MNINQLIKKASVFLIIFLMTGCMAKEDLKNNQLPFPSLQPEQLSMPDSSPAPTSEKEPQPETSPKKTTTSEKKPISEFSTKIIDQSSNRMNNIKLVIKAINGKKLANGESFSFNAITGKRTAMKGYLKAPIIVDKEKEMGIGGGVCQVSTTIFNAAEKAGMEITERHTHEVPVDYVEEGRDATVVYEGKDLKFVNNTGKPVKLEVKIENNMVVAKFWNAD